MRRIDAVDQADRLPAVRAPAVVAVVPDQVSDFPTFIPRHNILRCIQRGPLALLRLCVRNFESGLFR